MKASCNVWRRDHHAKRFFLRRYLRTKEIVLFPKFVPFSLNLFWFKYFFKQLFLDDYKIWLAAAGRRPARAACAASVRRSSPSALLGAPVARSAASAWRACSGCSITSPIAIGLRCMSLASESTTAIPSHSGLNFNG